MILMPLARVQPNKHNCQPTLREYFCPQIIGLMKKATILFIITQGLGLLGPSLAIPPLLECLHGGNEIQQASECGQYGPKQEQLESATQCSMTTAADLLVHLARNYIGKISTFFFHLTIKMCSPGYVNDTFSNCF